MKTFTLKAVIPANRQLQIPVPEGVSPGEEVLITLVTETQGGKRLTAGDLLRSPLFGMWKDRTDIRDTIDFARKLRAEAERRPRA